jgi:hypothetical protein
MISMDHPPEADTLSSQVASLRSQLKAWEKAFAASHGGRKAGREDIREEQAIGIYAWSCVKMATYAQ